MCRCTEVPRPPDRAGAQESRSLPKIDTSHAPAQDEAHRLLAQQDVAEFVAEQRRSRSSPPARRNASKKMNGIVGENAHMYVQDPSAVSPEVSRTGSRTPTDARQGGCPFDRAEQYRRGLRAVGVLRMVAADGRRDWVVLGLGSGRRTRCLAAFRVASGVTSSPIGPMMSLRLRLPYLADKVSGPLQVAICAFRHPGPHLGGPAVGSVRVPEVERTDHQRDAGAPKRSSAAWSSPLPVRLVQRSSRWNAVPVNGATLSMLFGGRSSHRTAPGRRRTAAQPLAARLFRVGGDLGVRPLGNHGPGHVAGHQPRAAVLVEEVTAVAGHRRRELPERGSADRNRGNDRRRGRRTRRRFRRAVHRDRGRDDRGSGGLPSRRRRRRPSLLRSR